MRAESEETDERLVDGWRVGDRRCGDALARRYHAELLAFFGRRVDATLAADLTQRVLLATIARVDRFHGRASFRHYTFSIARLVLADHFRYLPREPSSLEEEPLCERMRLDDTLLEAERREMLDDVIEAMPQNYAAVLRLRLAGYDNFQIGAALGLNYNTVRSRLSRAQAYACEAMRRERPRTLARERSRLSRALADGECGADVAQHDARIRAARLPHETRPRS